MSARQWKATDGGIREFRPVVVDEEDVAVAFIPPARGDALQVQCLIAAAPDLLKVARRWLRVMGRAGADVCACRMPGSPIDGPSGVMPPGPQDEGYICCRCEIEAAIARAEGRTP